MPDPSQAPATEDVNGGRRLLLLAPLLAALPMALDSRAADASVLNPQWTQVTLPDQVKWQPWAGGPPGVGEVAPLYGDLNRPGQYVVLMRWHPGYMSAPHTYRTDRLSVVISGTWWVNSGADFDPAHAVPVPAGGFVLRVAHTPHYDGVPANAAQPAVIALFGMGPVDLHLVDPHRPAWRKI
jgi:hypothetical protein